MARVDSGPWSAPGWTLDSERACWIFDGLYYSDPESRFALYARLQKPTGEYAEHYWPVVKPDSFSACWYVAWDGDAVVLAGAGIPSEQRLIERALTLAGARRVLVERGYAQESIRWPIWRRQAREVTGNQLAPQCSNNKPNREITQ